MYISTTGMLTYSWDDIAEIQEVLLSAEDLTKVSISSVHVCIYMCVLKSCFFAYCIIRMVYRKSSLYIENTYCIKIDNYSNIQTLF